METTRFKSYCAGEKSIERRLIHYRMLTLHGVDVWLDEVPATRTTSWKR